MEIKPGQKYRLGGNRHRMGETKIHIVKVFLDDGRRLVVYKWFGLHKRWWHYQLEEIEFFETLEERGLLKQLKR